MSVDGHVLQRRIPAFEQAVPFLNTRDLSSFSRTSRECCFISRAPLFRTVIPSSIDNARRFCETVVGNKYLGRHVRTIELQFSVPSLPAQSEFETYLLPALDCMNFLQSFRWLLGCKPVSDLIWSGLRTHCPLLRTVDVGCANGIQPRSSFFELSNLSEFRIRSWNSNVEPTPVESRLIVLPLPRERYDPKNHPLSVMLTNKNPALKILELNVDPLYRPSLPSFLSYPPFSLRELVLAPLDYAPASQDVRSAANLLVSFLIAQPALEVLRFSSAFRVPHPAGNHTAETIATFFCEPSLFSDPKLPDDALPNLRTFEGISVKDVLVICSPGAKRPLARLPRVEGRLKGANMDRVRAPPQQKSVPEESSSSTPVDPPLAPETTEISVTPTTEIPVTPTTSSTTYELDVATLSKAFSSKKSLQSVALRLHDTLIGRDELRLLGNSLSNVKHLVLTAKCACRSINEVLRALSPFDNLVTLQISADFIFDKTAKQFMELVCRQCSKIDMITVLRFGSPPESVKVRWAKQRVKKEKDGSKGKGKEREHRSGGDEVKLDPRPPPPSFAASQHTQSFAQAFRFPATTISPPVQRGTTTAFNSFSDWFINPHGPSTTATPPASYTTGVVPTTVPVGVSGPIPSSSSPSSSSSNLTVDTRAVLGNEVMETLPMWRSAPGPPGSTSYSGHSGVLVPLTPPSPTAGPSTQFPQPTSTASTSATTYPAAPSPGLYTNSGPFAQPSLSFVFGPPTHHPTPSLNTATVTTPPTDMDGYSTPATMPQLTPVPLVGPTSVPPPRTRQQPIRR